MIRALGTNTDTGTRRLLIGLDPQNLDRLREGQPILVNIRRIDPDGPERDDVPDVEVVIFFAGEDEREALEQAWKRSHPKEEPA